MDCLQLKKEDILLIHGATSARGLAGIQLAKAMGCTVIGTTRKLERLIFLERVGADFAFLDNENLSKQIQATFPDGITKVLELVGPVAIPTTSKLLKKRGIICSTGQLGGRPKSEFDVIKNIPNGVYLSSFYSNFPSQEVMDTIFSMIEEYALEPIIGKVFPFEEISYAHEMMESNEANGKIVMVV